MTTDVKCECRYQGLCSCDLCAPEPADRTILRWMPTEYMEAARAGVGKPDALRVAEGFMNARRAAGAAWMRFAARTGGVKSTHRRSPAHADDEATANAGVDPITPQRRAMEAQAWAEMMGSVRDPADRTILRWMPTEYMEAARAAQGMPDALAVVEAERVKVLQAAAAAGAMMGVAVALAEEALRQHEAPEPVEDGAWIVTVADLRETRRGKRIGNIGPVYDFEEAP